MRPFIIGAGVLAASSVQAVDSYSPFFFSSTANIDTTLISQQRTADAVQASLDTILSLCPTRNYVLVSQPGTTARDYQTYKNTPVLAGILTNRTSHPSTAVNRHVVGTVSAGSIADLIDSHCGTQRVEMDLEADESIPIHSRETDNTLVVMHFLEPQGSNAQTQRKAALSRHDRLLGTALYYLVDEKDYTLIYTTSASNTERLEGTDKEGGQYESEVPMGEVHGDLRRSVNGDFHARASNNSRSRNSTLVDGPLFEKYTFLSPGLFMGAAVALLLTGISYVGISALLSLQVTYGAFDKEQGALANKKAQ